MLCPEKVSMKTNENIREYAESSTDIATLFKRYFVSFFSSDPINVVDQNSVNLSGTTGAVFSNISLTEETVCACSVLKNLDKNKAHGPDEISA